MSSFKQIILETNTERNRIYTSIALFLSVISIFIVFAIRPVLVIAFELVKKEEELTQQNKDYEQIISQITTIQSGLQSVEGKLDILTEALPNKPAINSMIDDIQRSAKINNVEINKISGSDVSLIKNKQNVQSYVIDLQSSGDFEDVFAFQKSLYQQLRLKGVKKIDIVKNEQVASNSANLRFAIEIIGYYL